MYTHQCENLKYFLTVIITIYEKHFIQFLSFLPNFLLTTIR